jgi:hypothetical protein
MSRSAETKSPTGGEVLPCRTLIELVRDEPTGEVSLLAWDGSRSLVARHVEFDGKIYSPPDGDDIVLAAIRLPKRVTPYGSTRELFDSLRRLITKFSDLSEQSVVQIVHFVFATWLADRLPIAPFLSIVAAPTASNQLLLQLLSLLCRRALLLTAERPAGLWGLPMYLKPTLLLDFAELNSPVQTFLRASNSHGVHVYRGRQVSDLFCAKAVCSVQPLRDPFLARFALQISLGPTGRTIADLDEVESKEIADEYQAELLMYRLKNYHDVKLPNCDVSGLTAPTQTLARSLAACIVGDDTLRAAVVPLLSDQDRAMRAEHLTGWEFLAVRHLFDCRHAGIEEVRVTEICEYVNGILAERGDHLRISPETMGWKLKALGFHTQAIGNIGKGLLLCNEVSDRVHQLMKGYQVPRKMWKDCTDLCEPLKYTYAILPPEDIPDVGDI